MDSAQCATLITISVQPAATRRSSCHAMSVLPPASSSGFGVASDSGRMRSPRPAARIIAFMAEERLGSSERVPHDRLPLLELVEEPRESEEFAITRAGTAEITHDPGHVLQVSILAVAVPQPREDSEHLELALHAHPLELTPERREIGGDRQAGITRVLPVSRGPVELPFLIPLDVCVA